MAPTTTALTPIVDVTRATWFMSSRRPDPSRTRKEITFARSADGRWEYHRTEETGTPWEIVYLPTGQMLQAGSLASARRWTASGGALTTLRDEACRIIARSGVPDGPIYKADPTGRLVEVAPDPDEVSRRLYRAWRWHLIHEGQMAPRGTRPDYRCECGGYLVEDPANDTMAHIDACPECIGDPDQPCHDNQRKHVACEEVTPALCDHAGCGRFAQVGMPCAYGRECCCGCCEETAR